MHNCTNCIMEERIRSLENDRTETRVYVKEIRENIAEIKSRISEKQDKSWQPIVLELIRLVALSITIIGCIVGAAKFLK